MTFRSSQIFTHKLISFLTLCLCAFAVQSISAQGLPVAAPASVGMNAAKLAEIDAIVQKDIADKKMPGAVVLIGHRGKIVYRKAFGNRSLVPTVEPMTVDTIFDLASLTKVVATTTSIMKLIEDGKLRLNDTIGKYIPEIQDDQVKRVTMQQLMTHTSGFAPDFDLREKWTGREGMLAALKKEKLRTPPGTKFVYSDINFIVLGELVQRITNEPLNVFTANRVFPILGMEKSAFWTNTWPTSPIYGSREDFLKIFAPTENVKGQQSYLGGQPEGDGARILRKEVHDPTAFRMNGVAGHAGLFSTADDLARFCQMLLNGGVVPEGGNPSGSEGVRDRKDTVKSTRPTGRVSASTPVRILSAQTIAMMTRPIVVSEDGATRGLGWDINTAFSSNRGELFPLGSFGHTGFTGTSIWIDRVTQTFVIFLSNRVHPDGKGDVTPTRAKVATIAASAVEDTPIEAYRLAESAYQSQVAAQIPAFKERVRVTEAFSKLEIGFGLQRPSKAKTVLNGIDVLEKDGFKELDGKRVGLVTNHTGRDLAGNSTIDILFNAKNVKLTSLFAPEHGIRGELDTEKIDDTKDVKTGLPVFSLYKDGMRRPKPEQLQDLDAIVYDIQDVGARFYTYTATLKNVLEEAAKAGKPVYILDRPNPLGGLSVEGPVADEDKLNFIAAHTTPVRYGLTIGELGQMMNAERKIGADLRVIKMEGWSRSMWFDETGQTWINPSPNMRSLNEATLYPGIGLLETTNVSVGRGTDTPFEVVGAPWMDGQNLAAYLNVRSIKGVRFVPVRFRPASSVFKGEDVGGINIIVTNRNEFDSVHTGIEIACALRKLYPETWDVQKYGRLLVNDAILEAVVRGDTPAAIEDLWKSGITNFDKRKAFYLLYK